MNKKLDAIDKINMRLEKLYEYVSILKTLKGVKADELKRDINKRAKAERFLQLACEAATDIAELLIVDMRLRTPKTARETFEILGEENVLEKDFANRFAPMTGFRNILVHDYLDIDYEQVADKINNRLVDFNTFAKQIAKYLSKI